VANTNGHSRGGSIKGRLGALESRLLPREPTDEQDLNRYEEEYRSQLETTATDLVSGLGPDLSYRDGAFYAPDGVGQRLALSPSHMDLAALMGPGHEERAQELQVEAWERCLSDDTRAEEIVAELFELAESSEAPEDFWTWIMAWPHKPEHLATGYHAGRTPPASESVPSGCDGEPQMDPEQQEKARRLAWVLIHDARARGMLAELCRHRDAYLAGD
jgi:hypothetical protein